MKTRGLADGAMIPLALVFVLAQAPAVANTSSTPAAIATSTIHIGDKVTGVLPVQLEGARNVAKQTFELKIEQPTTFTVKLESFDFDAFVAIAGSGDVKSDDNSGVLKNAWLVYEATAPATLMITASSADKRGGEFVLSILEGCASPPRTRAEHGRLTIACLESGAAAALSRGDTVRALEFLGGATDIALAMEDLNKARSLAARHLALASESKLHVEAVSARAQLGDIECRSGNWVAAEDMLKTALADAEQLFSDAKSDSDSRTAASLVCYVYDNLATAVESLRGVSAALPLLHKYAELAPKAGVEPAALERLGVACDRAGDLASATRWLDASVDAAVRNGDDQALATSLGTRARFASAHGLPIESRRDCERGIALKPTPEIRVELLGTLASALIDLGRYEQALKALDELEALCKRSGDDRFEIPTCIDRALVAFYTGDLALARAKLEHALTLHDPPGAAESRVSLLLDLGMVLSMSGDADAARVRYEEAREVCSNAGERGHEAKVWMELGRFHIEQSGDVQASIAAFDAAAELARDAGDSAIEANAIGGRAFALYQMGEFKAARELARVAATSLEKLHLNDSALDAYDTVARADLKLGDFEAVDATLCAVKGLLQSHSDERLDPFATAGVRSRFADWGGIAQDLTAARLRTHGVEDSTSEQETALGWTAAGQWKGRVLLERIQTNRGSTTASAEDHTLSHAATMMPRVAPRAAIIEYVDGLDRLYAYVARDDSLSLIELGERTSIARRARTFVDLLASKVGSVHDVAEQGAWLYQNLLSKLMPSLREDITTLTVVPTPELATLPFEALVRPTPSPSDHEPGFDELHYVLDDYCVTYAPSCPVLAELQVRHEVDRPPHFLMLGDPVYALDPEYLASVGNAPQPDLARDLSGYNRLERTRDEVFEIARLLIKRSPASSDEMKKLIEFPSDRSVAMNTSSFDLYLGTAASVEKFRSDLSHFTNVHVAAHGHVDESDPRRSGLLLAFEPATSGMLPLEDVLALHLDADLVVLSACNSARGRIMRGEGVQSLAYGFLQAGARAVIATQWEVTDGDASVIMRAMYDRHFDKGMPYALALRRAKLDFRHSRQARGGSLAGAQAPPFMIAANPHFWAAFVIIGAPPQ